MIVYIVVFTGLAYYTIMNTFYLMNGFGIFVWFRKNIFEYRADLNLQDLFKSNSLSVKKDKEVIKIRCKYSLFGLWMRRHAVVDSHQKTATFFYDVFFKYYFLAITVALFFLFLEDSITDLYAVAGRIFLLLIGIIVYWFVMTKYEKFMIKSFRDDVEDLLGVNFLL
jgi:hypothetical protein